MSTSTKTAPARKTKSAPVVTLCLALDHQVYQVEPIPAGTFGTKAFRLSKKSNAGEVYDVVRDNDGLVVCDCPSYETTFKGTEVPCKHGAALVKLGLLDAPRYERYPLPEDFAPVEANTATTPVETPAESFADALVDAIAADDEGINPNNIRVNPPEPEFVIPAEVSADEWMSAVMVRYRKVATRSQLKFAARLSRDWETPGKRIRPLGPSLDELEVLLQERKARLEARSVPQNFAEPICCDPTEVPCGPCAASHAEPIGWPKPAKRSFLRASSAPPRPVKLAPIPDGLFTLRELVAGQAAFLRGQGSAPFALMASALDRLAAEIDYTGAQSVADYESRIAIMERDRIQAIEVRAFDAGYARACSDAGEFTSPE